MQPYREARSVFKVVDHLRTCVLDDRSGELDKQIISAVRQREPRRELNQQPNSRAPTQLASTFQQGRGAQQQAITVKDVAGR